MCIADWLSSKMMVGLSDPFFKSVVSCTVATRLLNSCTALDNAQLLQRIKRHMSAPPTDCPAKICNRTWTFGHQGLPPNQLSSTHLSL